MRLTFEPCRTLTRSVVACVLCVCVVACGGGDGGGEPIGGGTWPVVDMVGVTTPPAQSLTSFAIVAPAGVVVPDAEVRFTIARTGESTTSVASGDGAFVGRIGDARPGDTLEVRVAYDGGVSLPASITLPAATAAITLSNVAARRNFDGGRVGVVGNFSSTLSRRPRFRAFTAVGIARVVDSLPDGDPSAFLLLLDADLGETVVIHAFDPEDPNTITQFIELVVTP